MHRFPEEHYGYAKKSAAQEDVLQNLLALEHVLGTTLRWFRVFEKHHVDERNQYRWRATRFQLQICITAHRVTLARDVVQLYVCEMIKTNYVYLYKKIENKLSPLELREKIVRNAYHRTRRCR